MLLRIRSLGHDEPYNELTDAEMSHLMPEYIASQISGQAKRKEERQIEQRQSAIEDCDSKTSNALAARDGKLWLLDHGVDLDNVIYYTHTRKFAFGWRNPLAPEVRSALLDILSEFPFEYEFSEPKY